MILSNNKLYQNKFATLLRCFRPKIALFNYNQYIM
uniref:Uncharacterized protein n=1 Tax=Caudovirales sp. ctqI92 TaxID=2826785 RepID=A0A8S5MR66_9CAUD|nr:MAG TPA: hypothetical protein [Caudovirales sp. ctqI92]DAJ43463.1 MAG TPA: hypothetical protein [Caudoviricetes sp.]DAS46018.1 MAG TPA: hypothetical protein [Caudoviricetes sp.]